MKAQNASYDPSHVCQGLSQLLNIGDELIPPLIGNHYNGYINPYYQVDDYPIGKQWEFRPQHICKKQTDGTLIWDLSHAPLFCCDALRQTKLQSKLDFLWCQKHVPPKNLGLNRWTCPAGANGFIGKIVPTKSKRPAAYQNDIHLSSPPWECPANCRFIHPSIGFYLWEFKIP